MPWKPVVWVWGRVVAVEGVLVEGGEETSLVGWGVGGDIILLWSVISWV